MHLVFNNPLRSCINRFDVFQKLAFKMIYKKIYNILFQSLDSNLKSDLTMQTKKADN